MTLLKRQAVDALTTLLADIQRDRIEVIGVAVDTEGVAVKFEDIAYEEADPDNPPLPMCSSCGGAVIMLNGGGSLCDKCGPR